MLENLLISLEIMVKGMIGILRRSPFDYAGGLDPRKTLQKAEIIP